jgi:DNA-binding XRE family transcriptional regulator
MVLMTKPRLRWKKFGRDLRQMRRDCDWSIREMARRIKINHSTYVRAEKGMTVEAAHFLRMCYGCDLNPLDYVR